MNPQYEVGDKVIVTLDGKQYYGIVTDVFNDSIVGANYEIKEQYGAILYCLESSLKLVTATEEPEPLPLPPFSAHILSMLDIYVEVWKAELEKLYKIQTRVRDPHSLSSEIETLKNCIKNIESLVDDANGRCKYCALHREFGHLDFCPEKDK